MNKHIYRIRNNIPLIINYINDPQTFATAALICKDFAEVTQNPQTQDKMKEKVPKKPIYCWKIYCATENVYKFIWNEKEPVTCVDDGTHILDTNNTSIIAKKLIF